MRKFWLLPTLITALFLAACEPVDRRPGTWTSGDIVKTKITDWSFSNEHMEVYLQTHPWYGIPHSVTTVLTTTNKTLYLPSIYYDNAAPFPEGKYWNRVIVENPYVLVKIGDKRYPRLAHQVVDKKEFEQAYTALASKYPFWKEQHDKVDNPLKFYIVRLDPVN